MHLRLIVFYAPKRFRTSQVRLQNHSRRRAVGPTNPQGIVFEEKGGVCLPILAEQVRANNR
jgi:hypothetical protein